ASTSSSELLPSPLRPTTPMRSPSATPSDTPSSRTRVPYASRTPSTLTRFSEPGATLVTAAARSPCRHRVDHARARHRPLGTPHGPAHPGRRQTDRQLHGVLLVRGEERARRPRSGYHRPDRPHLAPEVEREPQLRAQRERGRLQVVGQGGA